MREKEITWSVHPASRDRRKFLFSLVAFLLTLVLLYLAGGVFWTVFGAFVLFVALYPFYFKTEYTADSNGITVKRFLYKKTRKWSEFRRIKEYVNGILLSPYQKDTFLENFRGEFLLVSPEDKERVLFYLKELFNEHGGKNKAAQGENKESV